MASPEATGVGVVLCDVVMPEMSGFEAMQAVRGCGSPVKAVAVTGSVGPRTWCVYALYNISRRIISRNFPRNNRLSWRLKKWRRGWNQRWKEYGWRVHPRIRIRIRIQHFSKLSNQEILRAGLYCAKLLDHE